MPPIDPSKLRPMPVKTLAGQDATGLTGDVRALAAGQSATLVDAEWSTPRVLLVTGKVSGDNLAVWTLAYGLDRAQIETIVTPVGEENFSRVIIARSLRLSATMGVVGATISAVVTPIEAVVDASLLIPGTTALQPAPYPNTEFTDSRPVSVVSQDFLTASLAALSPFFNEWFGVTFQNISPAGRNLFLNIGSAVATQFAGGFTVRIPPNGYYEIPFGTRGVPLGAAPAIISGVWDGADAAGFCNFTIFAYNPAAA